MEQRNAPHKARHTSNQGNLMAWMAGGLLFGVPALIVGGLMHQHSTQPHKGKEDFHQSISFADLPAKGDSRIKYLIAKLRQSPEGENIYQFASRSGLHFRWGGPGLAMGSYEAGIMTAKPGFSDDVTLLTIAHETRHHWQHTVMDDVISQLEPIDQYAIKRLREVDACAYAAQFSADFKQATGQRLKTPTVGLGLYGGSIAMDYAAIPPSERDVMRDAYEPCMAAINRNKQYNAAHVKAVAPRMTGVSIPHDDTAPLYRAFFKTSVAPAAQTIDHLDNTDLSKWATALPDTAAGHAIQDIQRRYERDRRKDFAQARP